MSVSAHIIADSTSADSPRMTTVLAIYPRFIHPEVLRHRPLSHSVSSSRAVPVKKMLGRVLRNPAEPVEWGSNQPGMQAGAPLMGWRRTLTRFAWHSAMYAAVGAAWAASAAGAHKQVANRIIEPWTHTVEIISGTDWADFFKLRIHDDADPTIRAFAIEVRKAFNSSTPAWLEPGEWHLPLVTDEERFNFHTDVLRRVSAARCARASYLNHDTTAPQIGRDLELANRLITSQHWSPFEHQATPDHAVMSKPQFYKDEPAFLGFANPTQHGNLTGWIQDRKIRELAA